MRQNKRFVRAQYHPQTPNPTASWRRQVGRFPARFPDMGQGAKCVLQED